MAHTEIRFRKQRSRTRLRVTAAAALLGTACLTLAACSSSGGDSGSKNQAGSSTGSSAPQATGPVNWWTVSGTAATEKAVGDAFTKQSGLTVIPYQTTEGPMVQKFYASYQRNQSPDVLFLSNPTDIETLAKQGMLAKYSTPSVTSDYPKELQRYAPYAYPYALIIFGIGYNTNVAGAASATRFQSWDEVFQPQYSGKFGMPDPNQVGGALDALWVMKQELGDSGYLKFLQGLKALKPKFYPSNFPMANALASGELAVTWIYDESVNTEVKSGAPVAFTYPKGAPAAYGLAAIPSNAPHAEAAKQFMNYYTSPAGQAVWSGTYGDTPANPKAVPMVKKAMSDESWYQAPTDLKYLDHPPTTEEQTALLAQFNQIVKGSS